MTTRTDAQRRAEAKYKKSLASITIRVKPEYYARLTAAAEASGSSIRGFIVSALDAKMDDVLGADDAGPSD